MRKEKRPLGSVRHVFTAKGLHTAYYRNFIKVRYRTFIKVGYRTFIKEVLGIQGKGVKFAPNKRTFCRYLTYVLTTPPEQIFVVSRT